MNFRLDDRPVILCDDVLFTGRSIRAALDALVDFGRPRIIRLAVLIDRGRREFPIAADYTGLALAPPPLPNQKIVVHLTPTDPEDAVYLT
jgi:pyrimidine operon attenuation protein / uracil phosphoribosyltransferase